MNKDFYIYPRPKINKALIILFLICSFGMITVTYFLFKSYLVPTNFINSSSRNLSLIPPVFAVFFSFVFIYPVIDYFSNRKGLFINIDGISVIFDGGTYSFKWDEIDQIGFQTLISEKSFGIREIIPYLALKLKDKFKINSIKNHKEYSFIQKKDDLNNFMYQQDVLDLYISLRFEEDKDSSLHNLIKSKSIYVDNLKPLVKTNSKDEYDSILKENFSL